MNKKEYIKKMANLELARRDFFHFCHVLAPDFYKYNRKFLVDMARDMQSFYESEDEVMIINVPPRHGKSRTASMFAKWIFGRNPSEKIMTGSYNEMLSTTFSKAVRNDISMVKADEDLTVYSDIFPNTKIKFGDGAMNLWSLEGGYNNYLATSPGGTATGFGASLLIIDDLIKNAEEAFNEAVLDKHWEWFCFTGDTMIKSGKGEKRIKDIKVGDKVSTFNHSQCIMEEKEVVRVGNRLSTIYELGFENGEKIKCTGNHKFYTSEGYKSIEEILSSMQCGIEAGQNVLFSELQKQSKNGKRYENKLFELQQGDSDGEKEQTKDILFFGLQERKPCEESRGSLRWMGEASGRIEEEVREMPEVFYREKLARTPLGSQFEKQRINEPNSTMSVVPYKLSQISRPPEHDVRTVYDIEVEDNHNFFANGMLVHNCNTMLSRLEEGGKLIIIMTRWSSKDLAGKALEHFAEEGKKVKHINLKAQQDDGTMLCDEILSSNSFESKIKAMSPEIAMANYQQEPIDSKGKLYNSFKTYNGELPQFKSIKNYTDTADTGKDYLCSINYGVTFNNEAYILDVLYTQESMETTEEKNADMLAKDKVNVADIESNNGGRGYARSVERITKSKGNYKTVFNTFHQSKNKEARILSNSTWVMENIYFPEGWHNKWKDFYKALNEYQKAGKNKHDDAPDALTGIAEKVGQDSVYSW